jgi:proteasome lid subunit RPN8/RPN11
MISIPFKLNQDLIAEIRLKTEESCGFLLGKSFENGQKVDSFMPIKNSSEGDKSKLFTISAQDYLNAEQHVDQQGLILIGVYHTHINQPAMPSELDIEFAFPDFYYIIYSLVNFAFSEVRCWRIDSQRNLREEKIEYSL